MRLSNKHSAKKGFRTERNSCFVVYFRTDSPHINKKNPYKEVQSLQGSRLFEDVRFTFT